MGLYSVEVLRQACEEHDCDSKSRGHKANHAMRQQMIPVLQAALAADHALHPTAKEDTFSL